MQTPTIPTMASTALAVPASLGELLADADARALAPALTGSAALADARRLNAECLAEKPVCTYCKRPGSTEHTSQKGTKYWTCAECTGPHMRTLTPEYAAALASTDIGEAARLLKAATQSVEVTAPDAAEPLITVELFTNDAPDDPHTVAAVYSSWNSDADLDSAGVGQLITNIVAALPRLHALRNQLAAIERGDTEPAAYLAGLPAEETAARGAFSVALDAIEAAFAASQHPAQTRNGLRAALDLIAAEARA